MVRQQRVCIRLTSYDGVVAATRRSGLRTHQPAAGTAIASRAEPKGAERSPARPRPVQANRPLAAAQRAQAPVHQFASLALDHSSDTAPPRNRTGLPDRLKAGVEHLSGFAMNDVRVHYNSAKPAAVHALAYTRGTEIHVGPGQEKHLPHEAWHAVQQKQGRVKPTLQTKGVAINDDPVLEREAEATGKRAHNQLQRQSQQLQPVPRASGKHERHVPVGGLTGLTASYPLRRQTRHALSKSTLAIQRATLVVAMPDVKVDQVKNPDYVTGTGLAGLDVSIVNRAQALAKKHGTELTPIEKAQLGSVGAGDTLYVCGHGGYGPGGQMKLTAAELAAVMKRQGLKANTSISLEGCNTGQKYVGDVQTELNKLGLNDCKVTGSPTIITTDETGQSYMLTALAQEEVTKLKLAAALSHEHAEFDPLVQETIAGAQKIVASKGVISLSSTPGVMKTADSKYLEPMTAANVTHGSAKKPPPDFITG